MNTLEVDSVQLAFSGRKVLSNVYLKCQTGDIVGILGRNGSGKSCLLKIIFGTMTGENQSVRLNENYTKSLYKEERAVKFAHQDGFFMNYLTLSEIIKVFGLKKHSDVFYSIENLYRDQKEKLGNLSVGVKKVIEVLSMLYAESKFVLLDEPFSFLSPVLIETLIPHILKQSKIKGIILTDHLYETVWENSSKKYILYQGNLLSIDRFSELEKYGYIKEK